MTTWVIPILLATCASAQLPASRLTGIFPPGGRVGTEVELNLTGADLDGATDLLFSRPGIHVTWFDSSGSQTSRRFRVAIGPDVPVGLCEVHVVGGFGISSARAFAVSDRAETIRVSPPRLNEHPPLTVGSIVNARSTAGIPDSYAIALTAGRRVLVECAASEIDSKLSPVMVLRDGEGHEVERSRHGGLLDFTATTNGTYVLQVHDLLYRGGPEYFYRLQASVGPHLDCIFPPAGQSGSKGRYTLYGRNLPGGSPSNLRAADGKALEQLELDIELPTASALALDAAAGMGPGGWSADAVAYRLPSDNGTSNPVLIGLTDLPPVLEQEPNNNPAQAQKLQMPAEVVGRFYPHGDRDWFTFDAAKGDVYWIEVFSQRMGLPSSPSVLVQRVTRNDQGLEQVSDVQELAVAADANVGGQGFRTSTRDGAFRFQAGEAGTYRLLVRDLFNTATDNAALTYRLSIHQQRPDFCILATPIAGANNQMSAWPPFLRRGGAVPIRLMLSRRDGFDGEVRVNVVGLPGGVQCDGAVFAAGQSAGMLTLKAGEDPGEWSGVARIVGWAKVNDEKVMREARVGAVIWPGNVNMQEPMVWRVTEGFTVAVSGAEQEPITFEVGDEPFEATVGGKAKIGVKIRRNGTVNTPLKITPGGLGPVNVVPPELTLAADKSGGSLEIDLATLKLPVGTYSFFLQAQGQMNYARRTFLAGKAGDTKTIPVQATSYSPLLTLKIVPRGRANAK